MGSPAFPRKFKPLLYSLLCPICKRWPLNFSICSLLAGSQSLCNHGTACYHLCAQVCHDRHGYHTTRQDNGLSAELYRIPLAKDRIFCWDGFCFYPIRLLQFSKQLDSDNSADSHPTGRNLQVTMDVRQLQPSRPCGSCRRCCEDCSISFTQLHISGCTHFPLSLPAYTSKELKEGLEIEYWSPQTGVCGLPVPTKWKANTGHSSCWKARASNIPLP